MAWDFRLTHVANHFFYTEGRNDSDPDCMTRFLRLRERKCITPPEKLWIYDSRRPLILVDAPSFEEAAIGIEIVNQFLKENGLAGTINVSTGRIVNAPTPQIQLALGYALSKLGPIAIVGGPGIGKTQIIEQLAQSEKAIFHRLIPAIYSSTDILGFLLEDPDRLSVSHRIPDWARMFIEAYKEDPKRPLALIFDEFTGARPSVQDALCRVTWERQIERHNLPPTLQIILIGNAVTDARGGHRLHSAFSNRLLWWNVSPDTKTWAHGLRTWARSGEWPRIAPLAIDGWRKLLPDWADKVAAFAETSPASINGDERQNEAWPTPRSWTRACEAAALLEHLKADPLSGIEAAVGTGPAAEIARFLKDRKLPSCEEILRDPEGIVLPNADDALLRICESVGRGYHPHTAPRWEAMWRFYLRLYRGEHRDLAAVMMTSIPNLDWKREALPSFVPAEVEEALRSHRA